MNSDALAQLRDIHLPEAISWWPPAPGWWLLALLLLAAITFSLRYFLRRRRQGYFRRQARELLSQCWDRYQQKNDAQEFVENLFTVIRRVHISGNRVSANEVSGNRVSSNKVSDNRVSANAPQPHQQALDAISSAQVFDMLDNAVGGELVKHIALESIESLLYQQHAEALTPTQSQQLYAAASRYLKRRLEKC